jgi:hypothetical protein
VMRTTLGSPCVVPSAPRLEPCRRGQVERRSRSSFRPEQVGPDGTPGPTTLIVPRFRPCKGRACPGNPSEIRSTSKSPPQSVPATRSAPMSSRGRSARWLRRPSSRDPEPPSHWCCSECPEDPSPHQRKRHLHLHPQWLRRTPQPRAKTSRASVISFRHDPSWSVEATQGSRHASSAVGHPD